uniref:Pentatricopeptide repeat-containing protein n=1 Tax=Zea mays TaxID=4577 RepID=A0A804NCG4_MAIZE
MKSFRQLTLGLKRRNCFRVSPAACATAKHVSRSCIPYTFLQNSCDTDTGGGTAAATVTATRRHATTRAALPRLAINCKFYVALRLPRREAPDVYLCTKLIRNLCRRGRTPDAARVLLTAEGSGSPVDVFAYNTLVTGYCRYDHLDTARRLIGSVPVAPDA